jgi:hypothetical protein
MAATSQDEHPGCDELMPNMRGGTGVPRPRRYAGGLLWSDEPPHTRRLARYRLPPAEMEVHPSSAKAPRSACQGADRCSLRCGNKMPALGEECPFLGTVNKLVPMSRASGTPTLTCGQSHGEPSRPGAQTDRSRRRGLRGCLAPRTRDRPPAQS